MRQLIYTFIFFGIAVACQSDAAARINDSQAAPNRIEHVRAMALLDGWKSAFIRVKIQSLRFYTKITPASPGNHRTEFAEKYVFEWPARMIETQFRRSVSSDNSSLVPIDGPLDDSWTHWFSQCINENGQCINVKPDGKYTLFEGPMTLSECAPAWMGISPWLCAQYLNSSNADDLELASEPAGFSILNRKGRWRLYFDFDSPNSIQLARIEISDSMNTITESTQVLEYVDWPTLDFKLPRTYIRSRVPYRIGEDGAPKLGDALQLQAELELLSVETSIKKNVAIFEIQIPKDLPPNQLEHVESPPFEQARGKSRSQQPSTRLDSGFVSWFFWSVAGAAVLIVGYLLTRRRFG